MATKKATPEVKKAGTVSTSSAKTETTKTAAVQKTVKAEPVKAAAKAPAAEKPAAKKPAAKDSGKEDFCEERHKGKGDRRVLRKAGRGEGDHRQREESMDQVRQKRWRNQVHRSLHKAGRGSRLLCDQRCGHRSGCLLGTSGRNGKIARGAIFFSVRGRT